MKKLSLSCLLLALGAITAGAAEEAAAVPATWSIPMQWGMPAIWWSAPLAAILAILMAMVFYKKMMAASEGSERMKEIAGYVREGAMAYLWRQYKVVGFVSSLSSSCFPFSRCSISRIRSCRSPS